MTLKGPLFTVMLCYGILYLHTPSAIQKYTWKSCVFYLLYSHVIAEHGGTKEKGGITSHQLSLYTSKILPEHILDTFLDLGLKGPEGSRAPESKRVCIWYWPWQAFPASFQENNRKPNLLVMKYVLPSKTLHMLHSFPHSTENRSRMQKLAFFSEAFLIREKLLNVSHQISLSWHTFKTSFEILEIPFFF